MFDVYDYKVQCNKNSCFELLLYTKPPRTINKKEEEKSGWV